VSGQLPDAFLVLLADLLKRVFNSLVVLSVLQILLHGFQAFGFFGDDHHQIVNQIIYREVLTGTHAFLIHKRSRPFVIAKNRLPEPIIRSKYGFIER
jgi:hypothetical protein